MGSVIRNPTSVNAHRFGETHVIRRIGRYDRSIHLRTAHSFTQTQKYYALQCFTMGQTSQKCPFLRGHLHPHLTHGSLDHYNGPPLIPFKSVPSHGGSDELRIAFENNKFPRKVGIRTWKNGQ